ncbi:STAS domain-containing protein [Desulfovibrio inopinatus]|uniref:STAS domain-containing protein n=1 Tax=Desulfovibrio inopinatus TaxID=102109 RepID=UPI0004006242|nr:STAS domain-containing protein [Desulfovibrio inopinatus]
MTQSRGTRLDENEGMHIVEETLIVPAPANATDTDYAQLKRGILHAVHTAHIRHVIIDVSRMHFFDRVIFSTLAEGARMTKLLGAITVFVGFQPGVVSALIDMDIPCDDLLCASTLEDGLALHRSMRSSCATVEDDEDKNDEGDEVTEEQPDDSDEIDHDNDGTSV